MTDLTQVMYEGAEKIYEEIGERHGYTGLCAGITAVCKELGIAVDRWYWSTRFHDPLSGFADMFARRELSFPELVRMWDLSWFGHGTGRLGDLPHPWNDLQRFLSSPHAADVRLDRVEAEVARHVKETKVRRGTKAHKEFIRANAREVVNEATRLAKMRAANLVYDLEKAIEKARSMLEEASNNVTILSSEAELRGRLLEAAGLAGSPPTDRDMEHQVESWTSAARQVAGYVDYLEGELATADSPDEVEDAALTALERSRELAPFPAALGLASRYRSAHPQEAR